MTVTIYHNPRCSKSRETLTLLQERGLQAEVVDYLKNPPAASELAGLVRLLGLTPRELLRTKEAEYTELNLANPALDDAAILAAMHAHPRLIERPIVVVDGQKAAIGRPPEAVLAILPA